MLLTLTRDGPFWTAFAFKDENKHHCCSINWDIFVNEYITNIWWLYTHTCSQCELQTRNPETVIVTFHSAFHCESLSSTYLHLHIHLLTHTHPQFFLCFTDIILLFLLLFTCTDKIILLYVKMQSSRILFEHVHNPIRRSAHGREKFAVAFIQTFFSLAYLMCAWQLRSAGVILYK